MTLKNVEDIYPLTPMQHLMLMHSLRSPGSSTLVNQFHYQLRGPLDAGKFARAWEQVLLRHEALRTAFIWEDVEQPVQVVREKISLPLEFVDLHQLTEVEREERIQQILRDDRVKGFDLRQAPLLRLMVLKLKAEEHLMVLTRHHLILDLWSAEIIFDEFFGFYTSQEIHARRPAGRFRHYIEWLGSQERSEAESYWTDYLQGIEQPSLLFGACTRRSHWTETGQASVKRNVDGETVKELTTHAQGMGITFSTILQGVLSLVLSVLTNRRDVIFGLTVSARPADVPDVEQIVGSLVNNVPLRTTIIDELSCREWLNNFQLTRSQRIDFEYISPIDLHRWSNIAAEAALFDVLVLLQTPLMKKTIVGELSIEPVTGPMDSALPLTMAIETGTDGLAITAVYDLNIVPTTMAETIVDAVISGIHCVAKGVPEHLGELRQRIEHVVPMLAPDEADAPAARLTTAVAVTSDKEVSADAAKLLQIFRHALGNSAVGLDDDFFALGGTSIQAAIAFAKIEREFGRVMPLSTLFSAGSVRNLMHALELPPPADSSLISIQSFGERPAILAVSGIDGNVVGLSGLARVLGRDQPLFGLQSKALHSDEAALDTIEAIAAAYLKECSGMIDQPIVLLGICFGADVVLEMAHHLHSKGHTPVLVVVLDPSVEEVTNSAPIEPPPRTTKWNFLVERIHLALEVYRAQKGMERVHWLREKFAAIFRKIRHRDLLSGNHLELKQRGVRSANLAASQRYQLKRYDGPISVLITGDRQIESAVDPRIRWIERVQNGTVAVRVPGFDTGDVLSNHAYALANQIRQQTDAILAEDAD